MTNPAKSRALRYNVVWPVRVRLWPRLTWEAGTSINISTSGVLVELTRKCRVGEVVELEVDFLSAGLTPQTIGAIGRVVRTEHQAVGTAAIQFDLGAAQLRTATLFDNLTGSRPSANGRSTG